MSELEILRWPDPRLSQRCEPVGEVTTGIEKLAADMLKTMYAAPGRGLAAPQVGQMLRMFVTDATWKEGTPAPMVFIDPEITACSDITVVNAEGCLSIPGVAMEVARPEWVDMTWMGCDGSRLSQRFEGFAATCVQHELDHLDGVVTLDHLDPNARAEAERMYAEAVT